MPRHSPFPIRLSPTKCLKIQDQRQEMGLVSEKCDGGSTR